MGVLKLMVAVTALGLLGACASQQVARDLRHAEQSQAYLAAVQSPEAFDAASDCSPAGAFGSWIALEFGPDTRVRALKDDLSAAAHCIGIPPGARAMELRASAQGGSTYYDLTVVHPSVLMLDADGEVVSDLARPRLSPGEGFFSGLNLNGVVVLTAENAAATRLVLYVHPGSLGGHIDVYTGYHTIPVPYAPYGAVRVRFSE